MRVIVAWFKSYLREGLATCLASAAMWPGSLLLALGSGLILPTRAPAEPVYLDGIAAQVGQEIILMSEIEEQLAIASLRTGLADSNLTRAREEVLQRVIDEKVIVQEAKARGITAADEEVEEAVKRHLDQIREQVGGEEAFQRELAKEGLTAGELTERYREEARRELLYTRLIQREIVSKIEITDAEIDEYYLEHRTDIPRKAGKIELAHVFIGLSPGEDAVARAQDKLDRIGKRLDAGDSFAAVAKEYSDDPGTRERGGDLGWFHTGDLDERLAQVAAKLKPGELSEPFQVPLGIEIVRLVERDGERVRLDHILVALEVSEKARTEAAQRANDVRKQASAGMDFAALVEKFSDDRESAAKGGNIGTFDDSELNPTVASAVAGLKPEDLSEVVETDQGFHIFKVIRREGGGEYELAEIRDRLRNRLVEERAAARTGTWLSEIRANYFIRRADQEHRN